MTSDTRIPARQGLPGIFKAVKEAGSQTALAEAMGVSQQAISKWVRLGWVPTERAIEIEAMYGVPRRELVAPKLRDLLEPPFGAAA